MKISALVGCAASALAAAALLGFAARSAPGDHASPPAEPSPAGSQVDLVAARVRVPESSSPRPRGPVVVYDHEASGPRVPGGRFPDLVLYQSGLALSNGGLSSSDPASGSEFQIGPRRVAEIVAHLSALGLFRQRSFAAGSSQFDAEQIDLRLRAHRSTRSFVCYGASPDDPQFCEVVKKAAEYLDSVVNGLSGGVPYASAALLLEVHTDDSVPDPSTPRWKWPAVSLRAVAAVGSASVVVPNRFLSGFRSLTPPTVATIVAERGVAYQVRWRPLLPHE